MQFKTSLSKAQAWKTSYIGSVWPNINLFTNSCRYWFVSQPVESRMAEYEDDIARSGWASYKALFLFIIVDNSRKVHICPKNQQVVSVEEKGGGEERRRGQFLVWQGATFYLLQHSTFYQIFLGRPPIFQNRYCRGQTWLEDKGGEYNRQLMPEFPPLFVLESNTQFKTCGKNKCCIFIPVLCGLSTRCHWIAKLSWSTGFWLVW